MRFSVELLICVLSLGIWNTKGGGPPHVIGIQVTGILVKTDSDIETSNEETSHLHIPDTQQPSTS